MVVDFSEISIVCPKLIILYVELLNCLASTTFYITLKSTQKFGHKN
jgi:hypothetical protein